MRSLTRHLVVPATVLVVMAAPVGASTAPASAVPPGRTLITLTVLGCDGCRVQPVQNKNADLTYSATPKTADGDPAQVKFLVPTARTEKMAFLVYAPFDEEAQGGVPAVAVTGFRGKKPGASIGKTYAKTPHLASGCWAGTHRAHIKRTLVVRSFRATDPLLGPGKHTLAAAYLTRTLRSLPFYRKVRQNALHASDPSICK